EESQRLRWLRPALLFGCFLGMMLSAPLWRNARDYPLLPIMSGFPIVPGPWDGTLFWTALLCLPAGLRWFRPASIAFLCILFFLPLEDTNRAQPWLYIYAVLLALSLAPLPAALAAGRVILSAVYVWAGVQKLNPLFFHEVAPFFLGAFSWVPTLLLPVVKLGL